MQGGQPGDRPYTAVKTPAEKAKFDRDALRHLVPRAQRQSNPNIPAQVLDWDAMAESWNEDVARGERDVLAGRLEVDQSESSLIHRKKPADLQNYWTESKKKVNEKRTMEPHWGRLAQLRQQLRVEPMAKEASQALGDGRPASFGVARSGDTVMFPSIPSSQTARATPAPCAFARAGHGGLANEVNQSGVGGEGGGFSGVGEVHVGGGPAGGALPLRAWDSATVGDSAFVVPPQACSTLKHGTPRSGIGGATADQQQVWNPAPELRTAPATSRRRMCQQCGH